MTEKILMYRKVIRETPFQFEEFLRLSFRMLKVAIWKILIFGLLGVVIFIFSFIPVLNLVSLALSYFLMAIDSMDYSWEVKGMEFSERVQDIFVNKSFLFGVSLAIAFVSLVPALPLVLMPLAIAGCAEYFSHSDHTLSKGTCYGKS
ncbi:MAG: hypothetical protein D6797_06265 [Bdellovibrio sp.]|nr:MAG: hypothetical protein D6797_06265 [Bdellovibrio sp.]